MRKIEVHCQGCSKRLPDREVPDDMYTPPKVYGCCEDCFPPGPSKAKVEEPEAPPPPPAPPATDAIPVGAENPEGSLARAVDEALSKAQEGQQAAEAQKLKGRRGNGKAQ